MLKVGDKVKFKHPYTGVILNDVIYERHEEKITTKEGTTTSVWYVMESAMDPYSVGRRVDEDQIVDPNPHL